MEGQVAGITRSCLFVASVLFFSGIGASREATAQLSPGPYESLPIGDAYIVEAFVDLLPGTQIADWTGWTASSWESPNAYNGHGGNDFAVQTGTPVFAAAPGVVSTVVTNIPENTGSSYGNYVRIAVDGPSPPGESLDIITAHLLPTVQVIVGQRVTAGQLIGFSDNTGNSTSEHCHVESRLRAGAAICPFYNAHFRYPVMFNPAGTMQVGHVVRVKVPQTTIRTDRFDSSGAITTAYVGQLYFASIWKRGYYRVFIPNNAQQRSGWLEALDVDEVFEGTVIQALPDAGTYDHAAVLQTTYPIRSAPDALASTLGHIYFGGGRFVADQQQGGWYHIPVPGGATWGWVKPGNRMVVYPQLYNPAINPATRPSRDFPLADRFTTLGESSLGRPKFNRPEVRNFAPSSPGGDGKALFITDATNSGDGVHDVVIVGRPDHRNYFVEADIYFNYQPALGGWNRYGIFLRDDGFGGLDQTFEGRGNCYAILWDSDDGRLRACRIVDATITDFMAPPRYMPASGWHRARIEALENEISYYLDGDLLVKVTDTTFPSGPGGMGYSNHTSNPAAGRGAYFDNFLADVLAPANPGPAWELY